jgi:hypothetical protein
VAGSCVLVGTHLGLCLVSGAGLQCGSLGELPVAPGQHRALGSSSRRIMLLPLASLRWMNGLLTSQPTEGQAQGW